MSDCKNLTFPIIKEAMIAASIEKHDKYVELMDKVTEYVKSRGPCEWSRLPTLREIGKKFKITIGQAEWIVEDCEQLELIVGIRAGGSICEFTRQGDQRAEYVEE